MRIRRRLNLVFLAIVLVPILVLAGGVHLLHGVQIEKSTVLLKQKAEEARKQGDDAEALRSLQRYIGFKPTDAEAQAEYALLRADRAFEPRALFDAYLALGRALRLDDARDDVRRKAIEIAMNSGLGRYADARGHLDTLLLRIDRESLTPAELKTRRASLNGLKGQALEGELKFVEAAKAYEDALDDDSSLIDTYLKLADLYRDRLEKPRDADRVMGVSDPLEGLVARNPDSYRAYLERARYRQRHLLNATGADPSQVRTAIAEDLRQARERAPDDPEVLVMSAELALNAGQREEALGYLDRAKESRDDDSASSDASLTEAIAQVELQAGNDEFARTTLKDEIARLEARPTAQRTPQQQIDLARLNWNLTNLTIDAGLYDEARALIDANFRKSMLLPGFVDVLDGRVLFGEGKWREAIEVLEDARVKLAGSQEGILNQIDLILGACYTRLANLDQSLNAYRRVVAADRASIPGRLGLGSNLSRLRRYDEAVAAYQPLVEQIPGLWLEIARILFNRELARPEGSERDWNSVESALNRAEETLKAAPAEGEQKPLPSAPDLALLRGQILFTRLLEVDDPALRQSLLTQARTSLANAIAAHPENESLPTMLVALIAGQGDSKAAQAELDALQSSLGDTVAVRLARAAYWVSVGGEEAKEALKTLEPGLDRFPVEGRVKLLAGLISARGRIGDQPGVLRLIDQLKQLDPADPTPEIARLEIVLKGDDEGAKQAVRDGLRALLERPTSTLDPLLRIFDLAVAVEDLDLAGTFLNRMKEVEGEQGTFWRQAEARILLLRAIREDDPARAATTLARARTLLDEASRRRPSWALIPLTLAQVELQDGNRAAAMAAYERARELGVRSTEVALSLYRLYTDSNQIDLADALIREVQGQGLASGDGRVARLAVEADLRQGADPAKALKEARAAVPADSTDYRDHLWLARFLLAAEVNGEAESEIRRAVELGGGESAPWVSLIRFLAAMDRNDEAIATIAQAEAAILPDQRALALALAYGAVGNLPRANERLEEAIAAKPDDPAMLRVAVGFALGTGQTALAEGYLDRLTKQGGTANADEDRRLLAVLLAVSGDPEKRRRARELAGVSGDPSTYQLSPTAPAGDARSRAQVLALQVDHESKQAAIRLLEQLVSGTSGTPGDQFLLAQLYVAEGEWNRARERMVRLLANAPENPQYLEQFARWLLVPGLNRTADPDAALPHVTKLERLAPDTRASVELRARYLAAKGRADEAITNVLEPFSANNPDQLATVAVLADQLGGSTALVEPLYRRNVQLTRQPSALLLLAQFLERKGDSKAVAAEDAYRRYVAAANQPEAVLALAGYLGRRGRLEEALDMCEKARASCPPETIAQAMLEILFATTHDSSQIERVGRVLEEALAERPANPILLFQLGNLRSLQGRDEETERWFRRSVEVAPGKSGPLNNLAWFLAMKGPDRASEAGTLIDRAIEIDGLVPDLLDTRAVVRIQLGQLTEAMSDLDEAIAIVDPPQPLLHVHRAWAYEAAGRRAEAKAELNQAEATGLSQAMLPPLERTLVERLRKDLGNR